MRKSVAPRLSLSCAADASRHLVYALDADKWKYRPSDNYERAGGNGFGVGDKQVMYTLDTTMVHYVAICPSLTQSSPQGPKTPNRR